MLGDWQSFNDIYGCTNNPWDLNRTPGGSSGGSAVSLATGMSALEIGSDIGASIRNPAHYCGVFGHKPTMGLIPQTGHTAPGFDTEVDIAVMGPLRVAPKTSTGRYRFSLVPTDSTPAPTRCSFPKQLKKDLRTIEWACFSTPQPA